jgi:BTB/POZ domain-containing protein 3/6
MQRCWEVIDAQAEEALRSEGFTEIDINTLNTVLSRETLNAKEISIFNAACRWADAECKRHNLELNSDNKRKVLGDPLFKIRIPAKAL